ncbi:MFS general substrate transporter [Rickenella mellea]|uniref:MFS general substrate transporter n=1 Tax=Rickenella mellea TaxID=50990 RepID=A0A4Y7QFH9_9AGAM|nr:MFS general substrate transporter [Rickenella mellea]
MSAVSHNNSSSEIRLSDLGGSPFHERISVTRDRVSDDVIDQLEDTKPSRRYQSLLVLCGFLMIFQVIGINSTYGLFQEFYTSPGSNIRDAQGQDARVALVGTIGSGLTWGGSIFVNPLIARVKNTRIITLSGAFIMSAGIILASFSTELWHLYLTQSLLYGVGSSLLYFPIMALAPRYFDRHRGFAMGLILSGSGVGGLVIAPTLHYLIVRYGVRWCLRILGLWTLVISIPVACVVRQPPAFNVGGRAAGTRVNISLLKRGTFLAQTLGAFLQASGNMVPLFYLTTYSTSVLAYPSSTGSLLLALNNGINSLSRAGMGILADRIGRQNTLVASVILSSLAVFGLWYDAARPRFIAFVVLYGIYAGGYNALLPTTITEVYGVQNYNAVNGFIYFLRGLGAIFGAPIAGLILGSHSRTATTGSSVFLQKRYNDLVIYDGALLTGASICVAYVRWLDARDKGGWKWKA